jgi:hypothetical protein
MLAVLFLPSAVFAADGKWIYATADKYAAAYYLDQVQCMEGDRVNVWLKIDLKKKGMTHFKKEHKAVDQNFKYFVDNKVYDCRKGKSATYHLTTYSHDGAVLEDASWKESEARWTRVPADSNDDFIMEELCMVCAGRDR